MWCAFHRQGRLQEAEGVYRRILDAEPSHPGTAPAGRRPKTTRGPSRGMELIGRAIAAPQALTPGPPRPLSQWERGANGPHPTLPVGEGSSIPGASRPRLAEGQNTWSRHCPHPRPLSQWERGSRMALTLPSAGTGEGRRRDKPHRLSSRQSFADYCALLRAADVVLDPLHYSAAAVVTTHFSFDLPMVTLPTAMMPGRVAFAFYRKMGVRT